MERVQVRIGPAALQPHLAAPPLPSLVKRRTDDGTAMATPLASRMRHDVLDHSVRTAAAQKVRRGDQHAGRDDPCVFVGDENHKETALASLAETPGRSGKMIVT